MSKYENKFLKYINDIQLSCCKSCTLDEVLSDNFYAFSYECIKCEDRYKTLSITNPEYDLETLFEIERKQKLIKYSQEIK